MSRDNEVFYSLTSCTFLDIANLIADRVANTGVDVAVAVAVGESPEEDEYYPAPHVAMTLQSDSDEFDEELQNKLFDRIAGVIDDMTNEELDTLVDVSKHPGIAMVIGSDKYDYAYMVIVVEVLDDAECAIDETTLLTEVVTTINNGLPICFDEDSDQDYIPYVTNVYGCLLNSSSVFDYTARLDDLE